MFDPQIPVLEWAFYGCAIIGRVDTEDVRQPECFAGPSASYIDVSSVANNLAPRHEVAHLITLLIRESRGIGQDECPERREGLESISRSCTISNGALRLDQCLAYAQDRRLRSLVGRRAIGRSRLLGVDNAHRRHRVPGAPVAVVLRVPGRFPQRQSQRSSQIFPANLVNQGRIPLAI